MWHMAHASARGVYGCVLAAVVTVVKLTGEYHVMLEAVSQSKRRAGFLTPN